MTALYVKVKEDEDLVRDTRSRAILNTDNSGLSAYREKKKREASLSKVFEEHEQMKRDLDEIKSLLKQLVGQK